MPPKSKEEQQRELATFREQCLAEGVIKPESEAANDDYLLLRFLRARQWNLTAAKLMLKNCEQWRSQVGGVGMEQLYKDIDPFDYPERSAVFQHWPLYFHKTDKKGRPINIHKFGSINATELMKQTSSERFMDILTVNCEALTREVLPACSKAADKRVETVLVIVDLKGFGISQFWSMKDLVRTSFQISQDYYPETMGQVAIINAPMTFTTMWSAIKPWLAKETVEKVDILGSDYQAALLRICDADALPAELGGTCKCAGEGGCERSNVGPWMEDRAARRAAWIAGERPSTALDTHLGVPTVPPHKTALGAGTAGASAAPDAPLEAAVDKELPGSKEETPSGTPARAGSLALPVDEQPPKTSAGAPDQTTDYATVDREHEVDAGPSTVAPVPIAQPQVVLGAEPEVQELTPVPPAAVPAGYAPSPPVDGRGSSDSSTESGVEPRTPASASVRSAKSAVSRKSVLSGVFGRKSKSKASRASSKGFSEDDSEEEGEERAGERKSRFKATVEKVLDKIPH